MKVDCATFAELLEKLAQGQDEAAETAVDL
jgi:hypothetical protein